MRRLSLTLIALILCTVAYAAPSREVRAAWIVTSRGLDWPGLEHDPAEQRRLIDVMLDRLAGANFNAVFIQLQGEGDVLWDSSWQPASADVTGDGDMPLAYDVAEYIINAAHDRGLDCYAIINPLDMGTAAAASRYAGNRQKHPIELIPDLLVNHNGRYYLNPDEPDAIEYLQDLYGQLAAAYDLDGAVIDSPPLPSVISFTEGGDLVASYDTAVRAVASALASRRPSMKTMLAVDGLTDGDGVTPSYRALLDEGYIDYIVPKMYMRLGYGFTPAIEAWTGTELSPYSILAVTPERAAQGFAKPAPEVERQIELTRDDDQLGGVAVYRASLITDYDRPSARRAMETLTQGAFRYPAHLPVDRWAIGAPNAPENVVVETDDEGNYVITWDEPQPDQHGTPIRYYTVYIARDGQADLTDPRGEIAHRVTGTELVYPSTQAGLEFAVTAFDANNAESLPAFSGQIAGDELSAAPYVFRFYADNLYISGPRQIESVAIYNMWGGIARAIVARAPEASIDCGDLPGGVYPVKITYADGSVKTEKFIK